MIDEIKARWENLLRKVPLTELPDWNLPEDTIDFLTKTGVPVDNDLAYNSKFMLRFTPSNMEEVTYEEMRYLVIGRVGDTKVTVQEKSGQIFMISSPEKYPPHVFANSSIVELLAFILTIEGYDPLFTEIDEQTDDYALNHDNLSKEEREEWMNIERQGDQLAAILVDELKAIDPTAFDSYDNYWPMDFLLHAPRPRPEDS